jgi:hypothetical protein
MPNPAPVPAFPSPVVAKPTDQFTFDCFILQITHTQCVCGERSTGWDLFQHFTAPARVAGKPTLISRLVPWREPRMPTDVPIQETVRHHSIAVCPHCTSRHTYSGPAVPPLDEMKWRQALKVKAAAAAAAPKEPTTKAVPTMQDTLKLLGL